MAAITGISGMQIGDGAGGKIALSIEQYVLRILVDGGFAWRFATSTNPSTIKAGTAYYYVPEVIQGGSDYQSGNITYDTPQVGEIKFNVDKRSYTAYEYELFDVERIYESDAIMSQIATSLAIQVEAQLNADFWLQLKNVLTTDTTVKTQALELSVLGTDYPTAPFTPDQAFNDYEKMDYQIMKISKLFDKTMVGVNKDEILTILAPEVDAGLRIAFRNQPNAIGPWQIAKTLVGKQIGNVKYITDKMLNQNIAAGQSFNKNAVDLTNLLGVIFHTEAIAMPINFQKVMYLPNPNNGNPRWLARWQWGFGILRPKLIYSLWTTGQKPRMIVKAKGE